MRKRGRGLGSKTKFERTKKVSKSLRKFETERKFVLISKLRASFIKAAIFPWFMAHPHFP